jgi:Amt family ammonium transporter
VLIAIALAVVGTFVILKICDALIGVRVDAEAEESGLDITQHGDEGYSLEG